jgi:hypothetical protein
MSARCRNRDPRAFRRTRRKAGRPPSNVALTDFSVEQLVT